MSNRSLEINYINYEDDKYPDTLRSIKNPPQRLYYEGNIDLLDCSSIAVIGSRDITEYGKNIEKQFVKEIALRDIVIVSGMAVGADRIAHEETLNNGGKTIAVMGTGFNHIYPVENVDIYNRILDENGLVITEYSEDTKFKSSNFPSRNRIISGISKAILVVEAEYRSGTSITAKYGWEQGKKVYAIPGRLDNKNGVGVNRLIKDGAIMSICAEDILKDFEEFKYRKKRKVFQNSRVKKEYRKIYELLSDIPISIEEISIKTNNTIKCTSKLLTLMEMEDLVTNVLGVRLC